MGFLILGVILGPLLIARVRQFGPSPRGIEVRPFAPKLNMAVVVDSAPDNPAVKPLVASLTGARPQPAHVIVEPGAVAPAGVDYVIELAPEVVFATPEACDRIAHALDTHPSIAVYPWVKTSKPVDALRLLPTLLEAMSCGAFAIVPLASKWRPVSMRAYKPGHRDDRSVVYGGGHVVAQPVGPRANGIPNLVSSLLATVYVGSALGAAVRLIIAPSWAAFAMYALYVFSISICLKQIAKFPRASALVYPVVFVAGLGHVFQSRIQRPKLPATASL